MSRHPVARRRANGFPYLHTYRQTGGNRMHPSSPTYRCVPHQYPRRICPAMPRAVRVHRAPNDVERLPLLRPSTLVYHESIMQLLCLYMPVSNTLNPSRTLLFPVCSASSFASSYHTHIHHQFISSHQDAISSFRPARRLRLAIVNQSTSAFFWHPGVEGKV
ncbi:hypothetical protein BDN67DRAFT_969317 [Paxillus ammoniavirescens]|nr:hypothetical protein BDN67DRAFT_969317 [Paxillus ammoniavirescens]